MDSYSAFHWLGALVRESTGVRGAEGVLGRGALGVSDRFLNFQCMMEIINSGSRPVI